MRIWFYVLLLGCSVTLWAQSASAPDKRSADSQAPDAASSATKTARKPSLDAPRSDSVNVNTLPDELGESSSKDTQIDLSPPDDDTKAHPHSAEAVLDEELASGSPDVAEFHPWDPHKAAKDVEVGDFYFKRKNYRAAEDRYREALYYKDNDAVATFRLAVCLEKMNQPDEARHAYESYLKILSHGPEAEEARKAIDRLKGTGANPKPSK